MKTIIYLIVWWLFTIVGGVSFFIGAWAMFSNLALNFGAPTDIMVFGIGLLNLGLIFFSAIPKKA